MVKVVEVMVVALVSVVVGRTEGQEGKQERQEKRHVRGQEGMEREEGLLRTQILRDLGINTLPDVSKVRWGIGSFWTIKKEASQRFFFKFIIFLRGEGALGYYYEI